jgi:plasmid stabilization system protein ParE
MNLIFDEGAKQDLAEAKTYYNKEKKGLGLEFLNAVEAGLDTLRTFPQGSPIVIGSFRQFFLRRFPYTLIYAIEETHLFIVAVAHQNRAPDYWHDRIE